MKNENLTASEFADRLQINELVISHILNGRNKPSLDVITKTLNEFNICANWLFYGEGEMYKQTKR